MSSIGLGVIGCGRISESHLQGLAQIPDARLVGAADINLDAAREKAEKYGANQWVADYHELLAVPEVDAVIVCAPTFLHAEIVCAAAAAGKHVLCEKPIAMKMEDAVRMADACAAADVRLMIGFVRHFSTEWLKLREIITSGRLGRPVLWRNASATRVPFLRWFVDGEKGGGPFIDGLVHDYDFARLIFGEAEWAMGSLMTFSEHSTALDTGSAIIHFRSGDELVRSWSWGMPGPACNAPVFHDVIGPGGALRFPRGDEGANLFIINADGSEEAVPYEPSGGPEWFTRQLAQFVECVQQGTEPFANGERGQKALAIALAVLEGGRTHQTVAIE
ncbi:MAG: Gfo/Idh/MocA family oxidoreductase [Armatimonadetes bacterium]|nr:Gfo/Idh/MocA family oxidoreductase [Armatimonadota bacterium]